MSKISLTALLLLVLSASPLRAQLLSIPEVAASLDEAKSFHSVGDNIQAMESIWRAQELLWNSTPLGVRNVALVSEPPESFGIYTPRVGEDFRDGEPIILYFEPFGFTQVKSANGSYGYSLTVTTTILDINGNIVGVEKNPTIWEKSGFRTFNVQSMLFTTLTLWGMPSGSYVMRVSVQDNNDPSKSVEMEKNFNRLPDANSN
ncbi:MAG: hypothetical protein LBT47_12835 [Deltaproteobacteria bacterium]|jgi:hypothetical protein|nr:hypothetical protein [Deltaproteobacteria bacterium]